MEDILTKGAGRQMQNENPFPPQLSLYCEDPDNGSRARQNVTTIRGTRTQSEPRIYPKVERESYPKVAPKSTTMYTTAAATTGKNSSPRLRLGSYYVQGCDLLVPGAVRISGFGQERDLDEDDAFTFEPDESLPTPNTQDSSSSAFSVEELNAHSINNIQSDDDHRAIIPMAQPVSELDEDEPQVEDLDPQTFRDLIPSAETVEHEPRDDPAMEGDDRILDESSVSFLQRNKWVIFVLPLVVVGILVGVWFWGSSSQTIPAPSEPTVAPTGITLDSRIRDIITTITPLSVLDDASTPQYQAYKWVKEDYESLQRLSGQTVDTLNLNVTSVLQRYALSTLYYATNGSHWENSCNFLSNHSSECEWKGIRQETGHPLDGEAIGVTTCDDQHRVLGLQLGMRNARVYRDS
jgi:hypothetical protein